jgi:ketosteroid isomerase-like protein
VDMTDHRELVHRLLRRIDEKRFDIVDELMTPDCELVTPDASVRGPAAIAAHWGGYGTAFPDSAHTVADTYVADDAVIIEGTWRGTNTGPLASPTAELPPTGRRVALTFCAVARVRDARVASLHIYCDYASMMAQLALVPQPAGL